MDLSDALDGQANNQTNSGAPGFTNPAWPGGQQAPTWPGQPGPNPTWPGQPGPNPTWPGQPGPNPTWPGGQSGGGGMWPGGPGGWQNPSVGPGPGPGPTVPTSPQQSLSVPFNQKLPNGVYDKMLITIVGTVKPNAERFTVELAAKSDLAFHFNARFNERSKKVIVRNSLIAKKWGKEERDLEHFPFIQGQPFEMKILCTNKEFKVAVNKSHLLEFKHRITNLSSVDTLSIFFDLTLSSVNMENIP
ncbi:galectin-5 [Oryzias latipes]|uniref:galectin-5 n=1 Tax=Oryzias latipes TaxID=8090 RepID=UPI0000E9EEA6|nr:galectin-5 [Oryzias latipes]